MKKFSILIILSFFLFTYNVNAFSRFTLGTSSGTSNFLNKYGNTGDLTDLYTLSGNSEQVFYFRGEADGSANSVLYGQYVNQVATTGETLLNHGQFFMCVSKPQIIMETDWNTCNDSCSMKDEDLYIIDWQQDCTLGLTSTETGQVLENDGYLVSVFFDISKWHYEEGAYTIDVTGIFRLKNITDSTLYYKFVERTNLSVSDQKTSYAAAFGRVDEKDLVDISGYTYYNNGSCVMSYNLMNNYNRKWNYDSQTLTIDNTYTYERNFNTKNLYGTAILTSNMVGSEHSVVTDTSDKLEIQGVRAYYSGIYKKYQLLPNTKYTISLKSSYVGENSNARIAYKLGNDCDDISGNNNNGAKNIGTTTTSLTFTTDSTGLVAIAFYCNWATNFGNVIYNDIQLEKGSVVTSYVPYSLPTLTYNIGNKKDLIFHWYDTNIKQPNIIQIQVKNNHGKKKYYDLVNCKNERVCKYMTNIDTPFDIRDITQFESLVSEIKIQLIDTTGSYYFTKPYIYSIQDVPGKANWEDYYQPYGVYMCQDEETGNNFSSETGVVYYSPTEPPSSFKSNVNGDMQNVFGVDVNFYGLTGIFQIPLRFFQNIVNGNYNTCTPLSIPFPGFPNKTLTLPCISTLVWDRFPSLTTLYNNIIMGVLSIKVLIGTFNYIKSWYSDTTGKEETL